MTSPQLWPTYSLLFRMRLNRILNFDFILNVHNIFWYGVDKRITLFNHVCFFQFSNFFSRQFTIYERINWVKELLNRTYTIFSYMGPSRNTYHGCTCMVRPIIPRGTEKRLPLNISITLDNNLVHELLGIMCVKNNIFMLKIMLKRE